MFSDAIQTNKSQRQNDNLQIREEKNKILKCHLEWKGLHTVLSQRCKSKLKWGSENAKLQEPPKVDEIYQKLNEFDLKNSLREKYIILSQVDEKSTSEYYSHLRYKGYMKGLIKLRIKNFQDELSAAFEKILSEMRFILIKNFPENHQLHIYAKDLNSEKLILIEDRKQQDEFESAYEEYAKLRINRIDLIKLQRAKEKAISLVRQGLASLYKEHELKLKKIEEDHKRSISQIDPNVNQVYNNYRFQEMNADGLKWKNRDKKKKKKNNSGI